MRPAWQWQLCSLLMSLWGLLASHHQALPILPPRWEWAAGRQLTGSARVSSWRWHRSLLRREGNGLWESSWGYVPLLDDFMLLLSLVSSVANPLDKHSDLHWQCVKLPGKVMLSIPPSLSCYACTHQEKEQTACRFLPTTKRGRWLHPSLSARRHSWHCQLPWAWNPLT